MGERLPRGRCGNGSGPTRRSPGATTCASWSRSRPGWPWAPPGWRSGCSGATAAAPPPRPRWPTSSEPGQAVAFRYPGEDDRALAIRLPDGRLVGWSAVCTHLACAVLWREEDGHLECPCHDGVFDPATGEVLAGPPPRPLPAVRLREDAGGIWAVGTG